MDAGISNDTVSNINSTSIPVFKGMKIKNDLSRIGKESIIFYSYLI